MTSRKSYQTVQPQANTTFLASFNLIANNEKATQSPTADKYTTKHTENLVRLLHRPRTNQVPRHRKVSSRTGTYAQNNQGSCLHHVPQDQTYRPETYHRGPK